MSVCQNIFLPKKVVLLATILGLHLKPTCAHFILECEVEFKNFVTANLTKGVLYHEMHLHV